MIRRTLRNGLVAALAAVAVFPVTAVAATAAPAAHPPHHTRHHLAAPTWGRVTTHHYTRLNVRSGPGTGYRIVGTRPVGRTLPIVCKTRGSSVFGNHRWYKLPHHEGYVSAHYVRNHSAVRWC
ncbi:SH3 domain-containing protein [Streptomyces xylophagus]|uniref:SH3 domain-containing protein n=1 Tax=Streptomyces xylophagus TaxID=285514 RepID=UPI0005BA3CBB|nr:SH3 domain-containing protein [Streptomyces xylophagus]